MSTEKEIYKKIGFRLQEIRKKAGLSQEELAKKIGVNRSFIARIETQGVRISAIRINQILEALGYDWDFTEKQTVHYLEIPDEDYQDLQAFIDELEHDPQYKEYQETMKRLFPS